MINFKFNFPINYEFEMQCRLIDSMLYTVFILSYHVKPLSNN